MSVVCGKTREVDQGDGTAIVVCDGHIKEVPSQDSRGKKTLERVCDKCGAGRSLDPDVVNEAPPPKRNLHI